MSSLRFAEAVALLMKAARTPRELCAALGMSSPQTQVYRYIEALKGEGLIYIKEWRWTTDKATHPVAVYAWQPSVCEFSDAVPPSKRARVCAEEAA